MFFIILFQLFYQQEISNQYRQLATNLCHKSCLTCYGQEKNNCLTCDVNSRRGYNEELQQCQCFIQYFDYEDECLQFEDLDSFIQYFEQEDLSLQCYPGEYLFNDKCLKCPSDYIPKMLYQLNQYLLCGNCYDYPNQFKDNLRCTYDYIQFNQNESFLKIERNEIDQTIYFINDQQSVQICFGCKQICIYWNRYSCFKSNYIQNNEELFIQCLENYYFNDGKCIQCEDKCEICSQIYQTCQKCKIGYYLQDNKCKICQTECQECDNRNNYYCINCITGYAQFDGQCIQCGSNCLQCQIKKIDGILFNICLKCFENYYRSIDFQNCLLNTIQNCLIEFQLDKVNNFSSLDSPKLIDKSQQLINLCAYCDEFYENHITKCQLNSKMEQNQQIIVVNQLHQVDSKYKNEFIECFIDNCDLCIIIFLNSSRKSICNQCKQNFYSDVVTGKCIKCPINCLSCIQSDKYQSDQWKRKIILFYQVYLYKITQYNQLNDFLFQENQIICAKCQFGYKEFDGVCIKDCLQPCKKCVIINGQSQCIQCHNSLYGQNLSGGLKCNQCELNCQLCSVDYYNKFGLVFQKCLIPYQQFSNLSYNSEVGQFINCQGSNKLCKKSIQNNILTYCDSNRYQNDMQNSNDVFFSSKNVILEQAFSQTIFFDEPYYFSGSQKFQDVMIKQHIEYLTINLFLHSFDNDECLIQSHQDQRRKFYRNQTIIGKGNTLNLKKVIDIKYFIQLEFINVKLVLLNLNFAVNTFVFSLKDCTIRSQDNKSYFQIYSGDKRFDNVSIIDTNINNIDGFFQFFHGVDFICNNFKIIQCNIINTNLFVFNILSYNVIKFQNLYVKANFKDSQFLRHLPKYQNVLIFNQSLFQVYMQKSQLFQLNSQLKLHINEFILENSYISQSILFDTFNFDFQFGHISNTTFNDSFIFEIGYQQESKTKISDLKFENIIIIMHRDEFLAKLQSSQVILQNMIFLNISQQSTQIFTQFYFFYISGYEIYISEFYMINTSGYTLLFIDSVDNLSILNMHQSNQQKQRISSDLKCKNLNGKIHNSQLINIQDFYIYLYFNKILVQNIQIENYAYISISTISSDKNLNHKQMQFKCIFIYENILNSLKQDDKIAIIQIDTIQEIQISLDDIFISKNFLMDYSTKIMNLKFTLIYIKAQQSSIIFSKNVFLQNFAFNSEKNLINVIGSRVDANLNLFKSNNYFDPSILISRVFVDYDSESDIYLEHIQIKFKVYPGSAQINFIGEIIQINSLQIINSQSNGLTVAPQKYLRIYNTKFLNIRFSQFSKIYLGAAVLIPLNNTQTFIEIRNSQFIYCSSVAQGGSINIASSQDQTYLRLDNISVFNSFSLLGSFLACTENKGQFIVMISNIQLQNTEKGLINHVMSLDINTTIKQVAGYFFEFNKIHICLQNILVVDNFLTPILFSSSTQNCQIKNLYYLDSIFGFDSPINIKIDNYQGHICIIQKLYFFNNQLINKLFECEVILRVLHDIKQFCNQIQYQELKYFFNSSYYNNLGKCMLNQAIQNQQAWHLIFIDIQNQKQKIQLQNILIKNNICQQCQKGLVSVQLQSSEQQNVLLLRQFIIQSNYCGFYGCLYLYEYHYKDIGNQTIILFQSKFMHNIAQIGGGIHIQGSQIIIRNTQILNNSAEQQGGGILSNEQSLLSIFQSEIYENKALIGSQISLIKNFQQNNLNIFLPKSKLNQINEPFSKLQLEYNGKVLRNNRIQNNGSVIEYVIIKQYCIKEYNQTNNILSVPSGQKLSTYELFDNQSNEYRNINLSLRILSVNQFEEKIVLNTSTYCNLLGKFNGSDNSFSDIYFDPNIIYFNQKTLDYNLDDLIVIFDPSNNDSLQVQVFCSSINVPVYSNQTQKFSHIISNYTLYFYLKTFYCQQGEYYNVPKSTCDPCDAQQYFYSVQPKNKCKQIDPNNMISVTKSRIQLRQGFWRPSKQNDHIEYCYHQSYNCKGGWESGYESCLVGHIGALCEQCDLYNVRGQGSFSIDKLFSCGSCSETTINILIFLGLSAWTLISVQLTVEGSKEIIEYLNLSLRMKKIGLRMQIYKDQYSSILLKLLMNYILILGTITTFQLDIPGTFGFILTNVSNPLQAMSYSLDCFLIKITDIEIVYFRMIWSMFMPFVYIIIYLFVYLVALMFNKTKYNFGNISTCLLYLYSYIQPNFIGGLTSLLAYRQISSINWISSNVSYQYSTQNHKDWIFQFILPAIIIYGLLIPLFFTLRLLSNKRAILYSITFRKTWGFLYNEYQTNAYFWEIIKLSFRQFIITFLTIYDDFVLIKGSLIFLMLLIYDRISEIYRPYSTRMMNQLDSRSNLVCASSIIIALIIYLISQQNQLSLMIFGYFLLGLINFYFISYIFIQIIRAYFYQYDQVLDKFKRILKVKFPKLQQYHPFIKYLLQETHEKNVRLRLKSKIIRLNIIKSQNQSPNKFSPNRIMKQTTTRTQSIKQTINQVRMELELPIFKYSNQNPSSSPQRLETVDYNEKKKNNITQGLQDQPSTIKESMINTQSDIRVNKNQKKISILNHSLQIDSRSQRDKNQLKFQISMRHSFDEKMSLNTEINQIQQQNKTSNL